MKMAIKFFVSALIMVLSSYAFAMDGCMPTKLRLKDFNNAAEYGEYEQVSALSGKYFLDNQGTIPQNVNYAIKKGYLEAFMGNYPECVKGVVHGDGRKLEFSDAVEKVRRSIALIEVY